MTRTEKRDAALQRANEVRLYQAKVKRDLAAGRTSLEAALTDEDLQNADLWPVLLAVPRRGRIAVGKALRTIHVLGLKRVGQLTPRQVEALCESLE